MPPKRKKKAKTPKTQSQSQRQSVTVNINTTKAKRSKSRRRSTLPPASYPPQFAPTFVTSNQDFDRVTPLLAGILQSQQQMFRDISVPTQPMIKAEEPTPPPLPQPTPPPLPPPVVESNFQKPVSLAGFGTPPPLQPSVSVQASVMGSVKDLDDVVSTTTENDFVSTSLPKVKKPAPPRRVNTYSGVRSSKTAEPVQPSKKSMIPGKSFFSKTFNPKHAETLKGKELENQSRKETKTEPAFVPEGRKPLNLQPRIGAKKAEQTDNPLSKQSVMAQRLNPKKSVDDDDDDRSALELLLKSEPPDARSQSLNRASKEGEETIALLQGLLASQSRPREISIDAPPAPLDAPPNIRPLIPPTRERSLSNMLNIKETPPPNIPETIEEIPKKAPERRLSISEKKMIKRQKAEEDAKETARLSSPEGRPAKAIPEPFDVLMDNFPKKDEEAKERARAAIAERARAAIAERNNVLKTEELDARTSRASMEEVIKESRQRQKMPDEDLFKIAKQAGIVSSVLPPKPPEPVITEPTPEKEPAYFIDIEPTMELDFRGKEIQETKQKKEQPTPAPELPQRTASAEAVRPIVPRGRSASAGVLRTASADVVKTAERPTVSRRDNRMRMGFISETAISLDEPIRTPFINNLSPIPSDSSSLRPRGTSLDRVPRRRISSDDLNQTRSIPVRAPVIPPPRTRRGKKSPISDSPKFV